MPCAGHTLHEHQLSTKALSFRNFHSTVETSTHKHLGTTQSPSTLWTCIRCIQSRAWATRYNTWLLVDAERRSLFFSFLSTEGECTCNRGGDDGNDGQHNSDHQLDEHKGYVYADLSYRRFTCNRVVTTVMMASTTVLHAYREIQAVYL